MICPNCKTEGSVTTLARLMVDSGVRNRNYEAWLRCQQCSTPYYGETEEYFFDDDFVFNLYEADAKAWEETLGPAMKCPRPEDDACQCAGHKPTISKGQGKLLVNTPVFYPKD